MVDPESSNNYIHLDSAVTIYLIQFIQYTMKRSGDSTRPGGVASPKLWEEPKITEG